MSLVFVNVKDPKDALQLAKGSEARSHVARYQWRNPANRLSARRRKKASATRHADGQRTSTSSSEEEKERENEKDLEVVIPQPLGGGLRVDPFRSYPVTWQPFMPPIVDHYLVHMAVDIPELDQPGNRGLLRTSWFPLVMTEPALFLVIMLLASSNHVSVRPQPPYDDDNGAVKRRLLGLRCEAMRATVQALALQSAKHNVNDAIIGAIAKLASYEAMFGTVENYRVHMQALTQAVRLRGGLDSLGLNGLLRRIVVWIDRNAAFLHGTDLYFPGATFAPGQPLPDVNPGHFLADS